MLWRCEEHVRNTSGTRQEHVRNTSGTRCWNKDKIVVPLRWTWADRRNQDRSWLFIEREHETWWNHHCSPDVLQNLSGSYVRDQQICVLYENMCDVDVSYFCVRVIFLTGNKTKFKAERHWSVFRTRTLDFFTRLQTGRVVLVGQCGAPTFPRFNFRDQ